MKYHRVKVGGPGRHMTSVISKRFMHARTKQREYGVSLSREYLLYM